MASKSHPPGVACQTRELSPSMHKGTAVPRWGFPRLRLSYPLSAALSVQDSNFWRWVRRHAGQHSNLVTFEHPS